MRYFGKIVVRIDDKEEKRKMKKLKAIITTWKK
jgi:hypothetical protein